MAGKLTYSVIPVWQVALMVKEGSAYSVVCAIKDTPDLMSAPEQLETTTLSDHSRTFMEGLAGDNGALDFTINYDKADIANLIALQDGEEKDFAVYFGGTVDPSTGAFTPTGENGIYSGKGTLSFTVSGRSVNGVPEAVIHITRTGVWNFELPSGE